MSYPELQILENAEVRVRTSAATLRVLRDRAQPAQRASRFLNDDLFAKLQELVDTILPQRQAGTAVPIAETIDRRLQKGQNEGWRFAELPPDGEAYVQGLTVLDRMLEQTTSKTFAATPPSEREAYLQRVAKGDADAVAQFPLSLWLKVVRTDVVRAWVSHPEGMHAMNYFGFADGATGSEGWVEIGPNSAMPFETLRTTHGEEAAR